MSDVQLHLGDCLKVMATLPDKSIDAVIADMPYGTTKCKWDSILPLDLIWKQLGRIVKPGATIVLFATQPFTSMLISSNIKQFKYCWTWDKKTAKGHLVAKYRPMQQTEDIAVFEEGKVNYYPIMTPRDKPERAKEYRRTAIMDGDGTRFVGHRVIRTEWFPKTLLHFPWSPTTSLHPTEKPVALLEYLIKTYSLEGDVVLDFVMGSGSTGVATINTGRNFIGCDNDANYFAIAQKRIAEAQQLEKVAA